MRSNATRKEAPAKGRISDAGGDPLRCRCRPIRCAVVAAVIATISLVLGIAALRTDRDLYHFGGSLFDAPERGDVFYPLSAYSCGGSSSRGGYHSPPVKAPLLSDDAGLANASAGVKKIWPARALGHRAPFPPDKDDYSMESADVAYSWDAAALNASGAVALPSDEELQAYPRPRNNPHKEFGLRGLAPSAYGPLGRPHAGLTIRFGVLGLARFVDSRLLPMLNTSLRDARFIDVFIRKTPVSHAVADYIRAQARAFHPHWRGLRVIELFGLRPKDTKKRYASERNNAWQNLEILRFWRLEAEAREEVGVVADGSGRDAVRFDWNYIMDDDGFVFVDNAKAMLWYLDREDRRRSAEAAAERIAAAAAAAHKAVTAAKGRNTTSSASSAPRSVPPIIAPPVPTPHTPEDNATYTPMLTGHLHVLMSKNENLTFPNGGPGYAFNHAALMLLNMSHIGNCLDRYNFWSGDAIAGGCLTSAGATLIGSFGTYNGQFERCFTTVQCQNRGPFPVAFHKMYGGARTLHIARELYEQRRSRGQLLRWLDLVKAFNRTEFVRPTATPTQITTAATKALSTIARAPSKKPTVDRGVSRNATKGNV